MPVCLMSGDHMLHALHYGLEAGRNALINIISVHSDQKLWDWVT